MAGIKRREFIAAGIVSSIIPMARAAVRTHDGIFDDQFARYFPADPAASRAAHKPFAGDEGPAVYFTRDITPAGLMDVYAKLGVTLPKACGVKISTGEPGGHYFLDPNLIKELVHHVGGAIVECNTAYDGKRAKTAEHMKAAADHGFTAIAKVDIMDAEGTMELPVKDGKRMKRDIVGSHFADYASFLVLSHFKGHPMGGLGGALKNLSIGFGSRNGKMLIHSGGVSDHGGLGGEQLAFLEAMAEAAQAVCFARPKAMAFVNVLNNISVDCDCCDAPHKPTMKDIGVFASLDPVAIDQACVDAVYAAPDSDDMIDRMESRRGIHIIEHAEAVGLGSRKYRLVRI
jgi:uncharacterized Fe-S center protein